jgi:hypothetical protein
MRRWLRVGAVLAIVSGVAGAPSACGTDDARSRGSDATTPVIDPGDGGRYAPDLDPADFVDRIDNPYLPLLPGARWTYEGTTDEGTERIIVRVLTERRDVAGIPAVVVRDTVTLDGEVIEDTHDWYAQDRDGNVWYLGEETAEYDQGRVVSTAGSWEADRDGAFAGIVMEATPRVGDAYRQEYDPGDAEDLAEVVRRGGRERVPFGAFTDVVVVKEWNPLAPKVVEEKTYARGVGQVAEVAVRGGSDRIVLVDHRPGAVS